MADIKSLGYLKIQTADIDRWRTFAFDVLGFAEGSGPDKDALYLRMDERAARIVVVPPVVAAGIGHWDQEADVVIAGYGIAGAAAAVEAARAGAEVLVLERTGGWGGAAALAGGFIYQFRDHSSRQGAPTGDHRRCRPRHFLPGQRDDLVDGGPNRGDDGLRYRDEMGDAMTARGPIDRYTVISTDTHAGADLYDYKRYLATPLHDEFDAWAKTYESPFDDLVIATAKRNWDHKLRIAEMDADGVAAEVLLPNTVPPFFPTTPNITISLPRTREEFEKRWSGVQAHNRWQIDFCSLAPTRRRGLIQIFPNDVDVALDEIRWGSELDCFGGVLLPAVSPGDPQVAPLFHTRYEPIWAVCVDLDLTVVQHAGAGSPVMPMDQPASNAVLITEMAMWAQRTLGHLILAGVFERHPTLRFAPTEQGTFWVQQQLAVLDAMVPVMKSEAGNRTYGMFGGSSVDELTMTPSEYTQRNCYLASELTPYESAMIDFMGADHIMWGSDYPHEEGFAPDSKLAIRWALHDRSEDVCRKILGGNAARLYRFDLDALAPIAAEIGPTVAEVHTPLEDTGYRAPAAFAYRPFEGGLALKRLAPARS